MQLSETKFNINQVVYYMDNNMVKTATVMGININVSSTGEVRTTYLIVDQHAFEVTKSHGKEIFATKQELLDSL